MNVKVKSVTHEKSVLEVNTISGVKELIINKTDRGYSYEDFGEWDITDSQYYDLENLVDNIMNRMENNSSLNVSYEV